MRIPSDLHGESLYGRKSAHSRSHQGTLGQTDSWRRVIRLSLVLVLIIIAMGQAARPGVYEVFFPEPPRQIAAITSDSTTERPNFRSENDPESIGSPSAEVETTPFEMTQPIRDQFEKWAESVTPADLAAVLAAWLRGESMDLDWLEDLETRKRDSLGSESGQTALALAIQQRLIGSVKDGTVWRAADGPALLATTAMHDSRGIRFELLRRSWPAPSVAGVLPLLQQPAVYRGRTLTADGELVRIEKVSAPKSVFSIEHYWNLWLLPDDATRRPWMVIVAQLPPEMKGLVSGSTDGKSNDEDSTDKQIFPIESPRPSVRVQGEYIKRLSYQSQSGAELTPVLVGHLATLSPNGNPIISASLRTAASDPADRLSGDGANSDGTKQDDEIPLLWIVIGSCGIGFLLAVLVMWRTAAQNRYLRERRGKREINFGFCLFVTLFFSSNDSYAQSLTDLLPGFDSQRMSALTTNAQPTFDNPNINIDEIAKLVFRMDRLSDSSLTDRLARSASTPVVGDAIEIDSAIAGSQPLTVSSDLQDYLELDRVEMILLESVDGVPRLLFTNRLAGEAVIGDFISGVGVRLRTAEVKAANDDSATPIIIDVAGRLKWTPAVPSSPADEVLAIAGVDLSRFSEIQSLDRMPLTQSDSAVFYPMVGAARMVSENDPGLSETAPEKVESDDRLRTAIANMRENLTNALPVDLLRNPDGFTGDWIRLDLETVRITRVAVASDQRRDEIGGDAYYEIDAIGDLGNVELLIDVPDGEPVVMENRYPVTIISPTLPDFLRGSDAAEPIVLNQNTAIRIEGFFYRLWGFESDLMQQRGGKQFAPLIIAGVITDRTPASGDPLQVQIIGKIASVSVVTALLAAFFYSWFTRRGDRESRKRRFDR